MSHDYATLFQSLRPELVLVLGALAVLGLDLSVLRRLTVARRLQVAIAVGALAVGIAGIAASGGPRGSVFDLSLIHI